MINKDYTKHERYAIQMVIVVACTISIILSVRLFYSASTGFMAYVFGAVALAVELMKFVSVPLCHRHLDRKQHGFALVLAITWLALLSISIAGSVGGLKAGNNTSKIEEANYKAELARIDDDISSKNRQIARKDESVKRLDEDREQAKKTVEIYQKEEKLTVGANVVQNENKERNSQIDTLNAEIEALEKDIAALKKKKLLVKQPEQNEILSTYQVIADVTKLPVTSVESWSIIILALVIEVIAAIALWSSASFEFSGGEGEGEGDMLNIEPRPGAGGGLAVIEDLSEPPKLQLLEPSYPNREEGLSLAKQVGGVPDLKIICTRLSLPKKAAESLKKNLESKLNEKAS